MTAIKTDMKASSFHRRIGAVKALSPFFRGCLVTKIGRPQIEAWKRRRASKVAAQTANIEAETLRLILDYAMNELRILLENPAASIKRRTVRSAERLIPSKQDFRLLVTELREGHKATGEAADFVEFLAYSGARKAEGAAVRLRDINFELGLLTITGGAAGTKNHASRPPPPPDCRRICANENNSTSATPRSFRSRARICKFSAPATGWGSPVMGITPCAISFARTRSKPVSIFSTLSRWVGHKDGGVLICKTYGHLRQEQSFRMAERLTFDVEQPAIPNANNIVVMSI